MQRMLIWTDFLNAFLRRCMSCTLEDDGIDNEGLEFDEFDNDDEDNDDDDDDDDGVDFPFELGEKKFNKLDKILSDSLPCSTCMENHKMKELLEGSYANDLERDGMLFFFF
mmetsp:Transcript_17512/g.26214  ORF Transcript_17512/g.26214 Transcript_17512/m.26214 type:complete len:111 (-) Transcript_17512:2521-2853(-)